MSEDKPLELCSTCGKGLPVAFCPCLESVFLCSVCLPLHNTTHATSLALPIPAFGHHLQPGYLDRLRDRIRNKEKGEDELMGNLKLIGDCQKELHGVSDALIASITKFTNSQTSKLQKLKLQLEADIDAAVAEVESAIYQENPTLEKPLARALWNYSPGSLRLFRYEVKPKLPIDLNSVLKFTCKDADSLLEVNFLQQHRTFLQQHSSHEDSDGETVISGDDEAPGDAFVEAEIDPMTLLSPEAKTRLTTLSEFRCRRVAGVQTRPPSVISDGQSVYVGEWLTRPDGSMIRHGAGRLFSKDGSLSEGHWKAGHLHLLSRIVYSNGDFYEGDFANGVREGVGTFQSSNPSSSFYGNWSGDQKNGYGHELMPDGTVYEGNFIQNQQTGEGKLFWRNGNSYTGYVVNGKPSGRGIFMWTDGRMYDGDWEDGLMHGKGKFRYADGSTYDGDYVKDKKDGFGLYKWKGKIYEGQWSVGQMHGRGRITLSNGSAVTYEFNKGVKVRELEK